MSRAAIEVKAKEIAESMKLQGMASFLARERVDNDYSIPRYEKEVIAKLVVQYLQQD